MHCLTAKSDEIHIDVSIHERMVMKELSMIIPNTKRSKMKIKRSLRSYLLNIKCPDIIDISIIYKCKTDKS